MSANTDPKVRDAARQFAEMWVSPWKTDISAAVKPVLEVLEVFGKAIDELEAKVAALEAKGD